MGKLFAGLFGIESPKTAVPAPQRMPDMADPALRAAAERRRRAAMSESGRDSTRLSTSGGGQGGTQAYANTALGQAG